MEYYKDYGLIYNPDDDTVTRFNPVPTITTEAHNSSPDHTVFTKDFSLNTTYTTWLRLYKPIAPPAHTKLPLILYFHYGGLIICSASDTGVHQVCTSMALELPAVVLSLEYRLAPEHRLPAAYEDAVQALGWIQKQASGANDDLNEVDFTKVYLMGSSAGGNIAYHAGLRALSLNLEPLVVRGYIFDHPFFGGEKRTSSEMRLVDDPYLSLAAADIAWELALPKGYGRDHEYCNPLVEGSYSDKIGMLGRCFLNTHGGDPLVDNGIKFAKMLERHGVHIEVRFQKEGYHLIDIFELKEKGKDFFSALQPFLSS